jgi:putative ABC transport system ATP-binding protein
MNEGPLVHVRGVHKYFTRGGERIDVLQGVQLEVPKGDFLALMGPSGSGKTTLLNLIGGLDRPTAGAIDVENQQLNALGGAALSRWRSRNIGFVFQLYNLLPVLTAERNVELPLLLTSLKKADRRARVAIALKVVGLTDRARHYPRQLSGGQEQRVGIARAIVTDPTLLLCDEPTGDLDRKSGDEILDLLQALNRDHGKTIVMVTHDPHAAERARRTLHLEKGMLMEATSAEATVARAPFAEATGPKA